MNVKINIVNKVKHFVYYFFPIMFFSISFFLVQFVFINFLILWILNLIIYLYHNFLKHIIFQGTSSGKSIMEWEGGGHSAFKERLWHRCFSVNFVKFLIRLGWFPCCHLVCWAISHTRGFHWDLFSTDHCFFLLFLFFYDFFAMFYTVFNTSAEHVLMKSVCYRIPLSKLLTLTFYIITTITNNWDLNRRVKS